MFRICLSNGPIAAEAAPMGPHRLLNVFYFTALRLICAGRRTPSDLTAYSVRNAAGVCSDINLLGCVQNGE